MKKVTTQRWVKVGRCGLYIGQWQKRGDAIAYHVYCRDKKLFDARKEFYIGKLSAEQEAVWRECKKNGDYITKATIQYLPTSKPQRGRA